MYIEYNLSDAIEDDTCGMTEPRTSGYASLAQDVFPYPISIQGVHKRCAQDTGHRNLRKLQTPEMKRGPPLGWQELLPDMQVWPIREGHSSESDLANPSIAAISGSGIYVI